MWAGGMIYMFYVNWPGQKLIDTSQELFQTMYVHIYLNLTICYSYFNHFNIAVIHVVGTDFLQKLNF